MAKSNAAALTPEEIDEELVNNDLISSGGVENQTLLHQMNLEEKKYLLRGIQQSKENYHLQSVPSLQNQSKIDLTSSDFPSLSSSVHKNTTRNKLKLPRKSPLGVKHSDSDNSSDRCINLLDGEDLFSIEKFSLPCCVSDGAPPLTMPDRPKRRIENPYFKRLTETPAAALKRMLNHHDTWKSAYEKARSKLETSDLVENSEDSDEKEGREQFKNEVEEKDIDHYKFVSNSPLTVSKKFVDTKKRDPNKNSPNPEVQSKNNRTFQRKTSRDSDCEEVQTILKEEEPKQSEWITATRPKSKRNRKQLLNEEKGKPYHKSPEIEFEFEKTLWQDGSQHPSLSSLKSQPSTARNIPSAPEVKEGIVQCPICQRDFSQSTVENHAATCEGYSSSPMDVEEEN